ncbi:hypothetical protein H0E87_004257 [Populus deltoides]|uniref:Uncharacterized protein n=1 Tax=Populus deltoides TaxID=3696 RepID=A0A8T2ZEL6_POPDE|nr:hypothetical protein H0E87_004257 [Populus deltoides]
MSSQDIKEDIKILDMKIQRTEQVIQEKKLKIERLQHKRSKLVSKLNSKSIGAEGLLERFAQTMAQAKEKSGHPSQDPSTSGEQMVPLKESSTQPIASSEDVMKTDEVYASSLLNKHYVIFNGPNAGCYREWSTVQPLVKGLQKFVTLVKATSSVTKKISGTNLKEISLLPIGITTAVKHYRQKVLKEPERKVYLSFKSSFLDWEETEDETDSLKNYPAYHFIKLGLFRRQDVRLCTEVRSSLTPNLHTALAEFRAQTFGTLLRKTRTLYKDSKVRINYKSPHIPLITKSLHTISEQDCLKLQEFECQFYGNDLKILISTKVKFCHCGSKDHKCD